MNPDDHDYPAWSLTLVTPHDEDDLIVPLDDMKTHLRVDFDEDDAYIEGLIAGVTDYLDGPDGYLKRALLDQTWDLKLASFPPSFIEVPLPPLIEVESISYYDSDDALQSIDLDDCHVTGIGNSGKIYMADNASWPTVSTSRPEPIVVRYRAGYIDSSVSPPTNAVPRAIIAAVKLLVGTLYENRENTVVGTITSELPDGVKILLSGKKVYR